jgi:hypothetical protein
MLSVSTGKRSNHTPQRRSYVDGVDLVGDDFRVGSVAYNPRPASMAFTSAALQKNWMPNLTNGVDTFMPPFANIDSEVCPCIPLFIIDYSTSRGR